MIRSIRLTDPTTTPSRPLHKSARPKRHTRRKTGNLVTGLTSFSRTGLLAVALGLVLGLVVASGTDAAAQNWKLEAFRQASQATAEPERPGTRAVAYRYLPTPGSETAVAGANWKLQAFRQASQATAEPERPGTRAVAYRYLPSSADAVRFAASK